MGTPRAFPLPVLNPPFRTRIVLLLLAALFVLGIATAASEAQAAGGAIRVLEAREHVDFPHGVGLSITAESDADIVEVRVFYRALGARTWGYAYADFQPGSRVVATQSVPDSESGYLAPGVDVEYYFQIKDAHGSVLKTERNRVEYLDEKYDWQRINIGPLELIYHDIGESHVADTARLLELDLQRVTNLLRLEPRQPFKGVVYKSYREANAVFPQQSQTTTDHGTFAGYAFPEQGVFVGQGLDRRIIVHESAHLLFRELLGDAAIDVPAWLNEGFATYVEPNVRIRGAGELLDRTLPLRGMNSVSGTPQTIPLFYYKSVSVVAYLIEEYGEDNFRRLLHRLSRSDSIEDALLSVYGFDVDGLDRRWAGLPVEPAATPAPVAPATAPEATDSPSGAEATHNEEAGESAEPAQAVQPTPFVPQNRPQERDAPSPFIFFDAWVLAGVAILVIVVLGFRLAYSRLSGRRRRDDEEFTDWNDSGWNND